jgi:hypothetical protein
MPAMVLEEVRALSLSQTVWARFKESASAGRVMAAFERARILGPGRGDPISLVLPQIGDGPLNIVVPAAPGIFDKFQPGTAWTLADQYLRIGSIHVDLASARVWEPSPAWDRLRARRSEVEARLGELLALAERAAPSGSLLAVLARESADPFDASVRRSVIQAGDALLAAWSGAKAQARSAAGRLAGLGRGLTPAGDDFLAGVMLWAWLAHPVPEEFCETLCRAATPRTTALSAAFLRASSRGECSAAWHTLLDHLAAPRGRLLLPGTVTEVLAHGQTSGADTLAGFLWLARSQDGSGPAWT